MTTPVINFGDYTFCFSAEDEDISMRNYFVTECGWTEKEYKRIQNCAWFVARVSVWKDGEELAHDYLGACCYKTEKRFYTTYKGDYFADMVRVCAEETKDAALISEVEAWHSKLRSAQEKRIAAKKNKQVSAPVAGV